MPVLVAVFTGADWQAVLLSLYTSGQAKDIGASGMDKPRSLARFAAVKRIAGLMPQSVPQIIDTSSHHILPNRRSISRVQGPLNSFAI